MQPSRQPASERSDIRDATEPSTGPVPLDPRHWSAVSGGSPKGGWSPERPETPGTNAAESPSPKGGW